MPEKPALYSVEISPGDGIGVAMGRTDGTPAGDAVSGGDM